MDLDRFQVYDRDLPDSVLAEYLVGDGLAVDTETMGLLPWRDRLCLVQLCNSEGRVTVVRIGRGQRHATNLKMLLEAETVLKVFHFARFDMATLRYHLDIKVAPVFCTKMASKLARTYTQKHGLKEVVQELEKVELDKTAQSSDWGNAANLSDVQLSYAANDVRYLLPVQQKLKVMLEREERWQLAQDCFNCLPVFVSLDLMQYKDIFEH
ncbi:ribonuclease D [Ancylothrix sp. C2]|uniref:ribonuclease H-like domain-containing protein n=1 Tax=Ancylothrix sp. D3o TaxID=2953691 RepID=UPI0021BADAE2|nr:ribonuclease H-like domain-containing protein [Ancylothrix sp. D3o]MCT7952776.1 ribonuclease D [Ancylothrix sp. D3o]